MMLIMICLTSFTSFIESFVTTETFFPNLRAFAGHPFQLPEYTTLLHQKSFIVRVLYKHVLPFGH